MRSWTVDTELIEDWLGTLDPNTYQQIMAAVAVLRIRGPQLGRPLVDRIQGSRLRNMKELRPGSAGDSEIRILFVFDPWRRAIMLLGGDKRGQWERWYQEAIPLAEQRYADYLINERNARKGQRI